MSSPPTPTRRITVAITAAVASTTLAIGVTGASLLGWFRPATSATGSPPAASTEPTITPSPVILVPITPTLPPAEPQQLERPDPALQLAMDERDHEPEHHEERDHEDDEDDDD